MPTPDSTSALAAVVAELQVLAGGRVQRVDLVHPQTVALELRRPGRTVVLIIDARAGVGRIYADTSRPPRIEDGGKRQRVFRHKLKGQILFELKAQARGVALRFTDVTLVAHFDERPHPLQLEDAAGLTDLPELAAWPDVFVASRSWAATVSDDDRLAAVRAHAQKQVRLRMKKVKRLLKNLEGDAARLAKMESGAHDGELLKSVLHTMKRGQSEVEVMDWLTGETRMVALDPKLTPQQNLERRFDRAKKGARGLPQVEARRLTVKAQLDALQAEVDRIAVADEADIHVTERTAQQKREAARKHPVDSIARRFTSIDGFELWVGRSAAANDRLLAAGKGHDVWLHARGLPGSHVLIRRDRNQEHPPSTLLDAAHLAAFYSKAKGEPLVDVMVTELRYVKKVKGSAPGQVGVSKSKTVRVTIEDDRMARLLDRNS